MLSKTKEGYYYEEFIYCECQCGLTRPRFDNYRKEKKYINGHNQKGKRGYWKDKKLPEETIKKKSQAMKGRFLGPNNFHYGKQRPIETRLKMSQSRLGKPRKSFNKLTYKGIHDRIKRKFPKKEHPICMLCKQNPSRDLACITGIYNEDLKNWSWFCIKCHKEWDNIIPRLILNRKK